MKKLIVSMLFFSVLSWAGENAQRVKEMKIFSAAVELIQKGILYNCKDCIDDGADRVLKNIKLLEEIKDVKEFLPKEQKYAYKFAQKTAKLIEMYAKDLKDQAVDPKNINMQDVINDYSQIIVQCTSCHMRVRGW